MLRQSQFLAGQQIEMGKKIYADQVYKTATANKDTGMLAEAYYLYGKMAIPVNDSVAIGWFQKSLKLLKPKGPSFEVGRLYFAIAILAKKHGNTKVYQKYIELEASDNRFKF
ncbi:MAG: hypothetical protein IPH28_19775 [Cytophagaceae bacterium]|nr:hypothetical protein [Cytophagaceae bacterium]